MPMSVARRLAEGVGGWLLYEFHGNKSELFNERYLSTPVSTILHSAHSGQIFAEYKHPVLAQNKSGRGRPPEVDFAVSTIYPAISCAIETKWLGGSLLNAEKILWDLLRLELIAAHSRADTYFLLAGRRKHFDAFFKSAAFVGKPNETGKDRRLLPVPHLNHLPVAKPSALNVTHPPKDLKEVYKSLFKSYQQVDFPRRLTVTAPEIYPKDAPAYQYQVYVWSVKANANTPRFKPETHKLYKAKLHFTESDS